MRGSAPFRARLRRQQVVSQHVLRFATEDAKKTERQIRNKQTLPMLELRSLFAEQPASKWKTPMRRLSHDRPDKIVVRHNTSTRERCSTNHGFRQSSFIEWQIDPIDLNLGGSNEGKSTTFHCQFPKTKPNVKY